jgi:hypothetical protein
MKGNRRWKVRVVFGRQVAGAFVKCCEASEATNEQMIDTSEHERKESRAIKRMQFDRQVICALKERERERAQIN